MVSPPARTPGKRGHCLRSGCFSSHTWVSVLFAGRGDIQPQLDSALQDVNDKYLLLEETEKQAVRKALIEERGRFCTFISMLRPVIVSSWNIPEVQKGQFRGDFPYLFTSFIYLSVVESLGICCVRNHDRNHNLLTTSLGQRCSASCWWLPGPLLGHGS